MPIEKDAKPNENGPRPCVPSVDSSHIGGTGFYSYEPPAHGGASTTTPAATTCGVEPRVGVEPQPAAPGEVDVWLWEWQVAEDRRQVTLGETVAWDLVPMDHNWITRLFADRRSVPLQLDTYAGHSEPAAEPEWTRMSGVVQRIDQVSVRDVQTTAPSDRVPEHGAAVVHTVSSIRPEQTHTGSLTGWIVRLQESDGAEDCPGRRFS